MVFVDKTLTVYELLVKVYEIVVCDLDRFVYELVSVFNIDDWVIRLNIKTDRDLTLYFSKSKCESSINIC